MDERLTSQERAVRLSESLGRLRNYDRVQSRPGIQLVNVTERVGRNEPCPCGSGRKFKHCCMGK